MSRLKFNIKFRPQIDSGEYKVETRDGRPVRIIIWDRKYVFPICGLATEADGHESYVNCDSGGRATRTREDSSDLFIVTPEEELTEFEQRIENLLNLALPEGHAGTTIEKTKRVAAELLAVARKEITPSFGKEYETGYLDGMDDTLKDLPRWIESGCVTKVLYAIIKTWHGEYRIGAAVEPGDRFIPLCMLEKLPGFND